MDERLADRAGDGPVDAVYRTIAAITQTKSTLLMYVVKAITGGPMPKAKSRSVFKKMGARFQGMARTRTSSWPQQKPI